MTPNEHIGQSFLAIRKYRKLTQTELADLAGIDQARIAELEAGKGNPTLATLIAVASALTCALDISLTPR